ncbi:AAEL002726-PA [Aedes aegypti]|uniref:AAEL002726-PA n=1 Tax=Aedes aegypti TaxID=7159 RepID=Q17HF3_AEDAE|nr:AAEL002726-PA [Aedes aegypti]
MAQYKQYKQFLDCSEQEVNDLADKLERHSGLHDCDAIFRVFKESILEPAELLRKMFLLDPESASTVRSYMGSAIRQLNESVFEYCENKFYNDKRDIWCAARNYSIPEDKDFHRHIECIFNGLHYFNRGGDLDVDEICRDFHQVGITDLDNEVSEVLRSCDVNPETKALSYYRCLLESDFLDKFKEALDYREIRSADHFYALKDPMPVYDRNQIQSQINSVNRECCSI